MLRSLGIFSISDEFLGFFLNSERILREFWCSKVRFVRSVADRTFQPWGRRRGRKRPIVEIAASAGWRGGKQGGGTSLAYAAAQFHSFAVVQSIHQLSLSNFDRVVFGGPRRFRKYRRPSQRLNTPWKALDEIYLCPWVHSWVMPSIFSHLITWSRKVLSFSFSARYLRIKNLADFITY